MNKSQSKYFNTALKMDEALITLLGKKDFEYITIKEICQLAGVNRSTFYLHYENTADLLGETVRNMTDRFISYFPYDSESKIANFKDCPLEELNFISKDYLRPYLSYIKDNKTVFKTAVTQPNCFDSKAIYQRLFEYVFDPILERFDFPKNQRQYVMTFYLNGITAITMEWLKNDCQTPIDEICEIITICIMHKQK